MKYFGKWAIMATIAVLVMALGSVGLAMVDQSGVSVVFEQSADMALMHGPPVSIVDNGQESQLLISGNVLNVMGHCHLTAAQFGAVVQDTASHTATRSAEVGSWRSRPNLHSL